MHFYHKPCIMIGIGGALGALSRFYLSIFIDLQTLNLRQLFNTSQSTSDAISANISIDITTTHSLFDLLSASSLSTSLDLFFSLFPLSILCINMLGSFALGLFLTYMQYTEKNNIPLRNFFAVGFLGAFTTFSTFIMDSVQLTIPFLLQFTILQENFPLLEKATHSLQMLFSLHPKALVVNHSLLFALLNILLNLTLCILCVALGHNKMKKRYS